MKLLSSKNIKMAMPAYMTCVAYIILIVVWLLPVQIPQTDPQDTNRVIARSYTFYERLLIVILMTIPMTVFIYTIHCAVAGQCVMYAYFLAGVVVCWIILALLYTILFSAKKDIRP